MLDLSKITGRVKSFLKSDIAVKVIVAVGLVGMALILIGQLRGGGSSKSKEPMDTSTAQYTTDEYAALLEDKLQNLITSIEGVGQAQVMVTLEHGVSYVYAQEEKTSLDRNVEPEGDGAEKISLKQDIQSNYVLIDSEYGKKQPLITTQLQPKVQGVVIVCEGANDVRVEQSLINVVTTALNISTTKVCVVKIDTYDQKDFIQEEVR